MTIYTIGHSNHDLDKLLALLKAAGVELLLDVRSTPFSRRNPQFNRPQLSEALEGAGIAYRHVPEFGGRRSPGPSPSSNDALPQGPFRNYADYAQTPAFQETIAKLRMAAAKKVCAIMCAEADWHHCHRRIMTDHLLSWGEEVLHLTSKGDGEKAEPDPLALIEGPGQVSYPARQRDLF